MSGIDNNEEIEYIASIIKSAAKLPERLQKIGASEVSWWEGKPGDAVIMASGGTAADRIFAESIVKDQLEAFGYKRATFYFADINDEQDYDPLAEVPDYQEQEEAPEEGESISGRPENQRTPEESIDRTRNLWGNIMEKAKRLISSGNVQVLRNLPNLIVANVNGDHGRYVVEIGRDDPESSSITSWKCECPWDQYAWGRTRQWKKYEGRPCSHVLAAYWFASKAPLDREEEPSVRKVVPKDQLGKPTPQQGVDPQGKPTPSLFGEPSVFTQDPGTETGAVPPPQGLPRGLYQFHAPGPQEEEIQKRFMEPRGLNYQQQEPYRPEQDQALQRKDIRSIIPESPVERQQRELEEQEQRRQQISDPTKSVGPTPGNPMQQMQVWSSIKDSGETPGWYNYTQGPDRKNNLVILKEDIMAEVEGSDGEYAEIPAGTTCQVESEFQLPGLGKQIELTCMLNPGTAEEKLVRTFVSPSNIQTESIKEEVDNPENIAEFEGDMPIWEDVQE